MNAAILFLAFLAVAAILYALLARRWRPSGEGQSDYIRRGALFSPAERSFLGVLEQAVGSDYRILGKVRVADVLEVMARDRAAHLRAFNRISAKHFDFLLCTPDEIVPLCAIELDDRSHRGAARRRRDAFLEHACRDAALPLLRIPATRSYSVEALRDAVLRATTVAPPPAVRREPVFDEGEVEPDPPPGRVEPTIGPLVAGAAEAAPPCPKCGGGMRRRRAVSGPHAGREFWACAAFPDCRTAVPVRAEGATA
ncbi:DUF2726 domain-containing protein [Ectothiorhodospiraceae bacterium 2226]|nr:DUF2726 domain-containing protein [Ectothiorhodospiraceae bacterium 2226]